MLDGLFFNFSSLTIQEYLFNEEGYAIVRQEVALVLAERRRSRKPDLVKAKARLAHVEQEIANVLAFVKGGRWSETMKSELVQLEEEQKQLRYQLNGKAKADPVTDFLPDTIGRFRAALADLATEGHLAGIDGLADRTAPNG